MPIVKYYDEDSETWVPLPGGVRGARGSDGLVSGRWRFFSGALTQNYQLAVTSLTAASVTSISVGIAGVPSNPATEVFARLTLWNQVVRISNESTGEWAVYRLGANPQEVTNSGVTVGWNYPVTFIVSSVVSPFANNDYVYMSLSGDAALWNPLILPGNNQTDYDVSVWPSLPVNATPDIGMTGGHGIVNFQSTSINDWGDEYLATYTENGLGLVQNGVMDILSGHSVWTETDHGSVAYQEEGSFLYVNKDYVDISAPKGIFLYSDTEGIELNSNYGISLISYGGSVSISPSLFTDLGSTSVAAYSFNGYPSTGMYSPAANQVGFAVGGDVAMRMTTNYVVPKKPILLDAGTASAPTLTFDNDGDTGVYQVGSDQLGVTTGGTLRLQIDNNSIKPSVPIRVVDGTASAPAYSFVNDTDTGIFRYDDDAIAVAAGGSSRIIVRSNIIQSNGGMEIGGASFNDWALLGDNPSLFRSTNSGSTYPFTQAGGLVLAARASANSDIVFATRQSGSGTNLSPKVRVTAVDSAYNNLEVTNGTNWQTVWNTGNVPITSGTFTPSLGGSTTDPTSVTYVSGQRWGYYVRIGPLVFVSLRVETSAVTGGTGNVRIKGLPFTHRNSDISMLSGRVANLPLMVSSNAVDPYFYMDPNQSQINVNYSRHNATGAAYPLTDWGANGGVIISGVYEV